MRDAFVPLVASLLVWPSSGHCDETYNRLIVGGSYQDLPGASGRSVGVDWVRSGAVRVVSFGSESVSVADSQWSVARGSVYRRLSGGADIFGSAAVGPASTNGESFSYKRLEAAATVPLTASWRLVARDTFVDVEPIRGHVLTLGANVRRGTVTTQFEVSQGVGGNIEQHGINLRIDGRIRKATVFAGALVGNSNNRLLLNEAGATVSEARMHQAYAGMTLLLGRVDLTLTVDVASSGSTRRQSIGTFIGIPLASK
jgi:hypothetical protein